jgi:hypothetical protein
MAAERPAAHVMGAATQAGLPCAVTAMISLAN